MTDPKITAAELAAGTAVVKKYVTALPWWEKNMISDDMIKKIVTDVVASIDAVRDQGTLK